MSTWPFDPPVRPVEARVRESVPADPGWAYEPKWDGFRVLGWSDEPRLDSRNERPLLRYFPELRPALEALPGGTVVDGEVIVVLEGVQQFDALQQRLHPAESRVEKLARETPATLVAFDLLALRGADLRGLPFEARREALEGLARDLSPGWELSPLTRDPGLAERWLHDLESAGCDGIVAKRLDRSYRLGERDMVKVKLRRTVDAVVGGFRVAKDGRGIGSLLLGLFDEAGALHFVGHCSNFGAEERATLLERFALLEATDSFGAEARRPEREHRWAATRTSGEWVPVSPTVVAEVSYDQVTSGRIRHAARFERWRPDKDAVECSIDQLERPAGPGIEAVLGPSRAGTG